MGFLVRLKKPSQIVVLGIKTKFIANSPCSGIILNGKLTQNPLHYLIMCFQSCCQRQHVSHHGSWFLHTGRTCRIITMYRFLPARLSANTTFISVNIKHIHVSNGIIPCYKMQLVHLKFEITSKTLLLLKHQLQDLRSFAQGIFFNFARTKITHLAALYIEIKPAPPQAFPWCLSAKQDGESVSKYVNVFDHSKLSIYRL